MRRSKTTQQDRIIVSLLTSLLLLTVGLTVYKSISHTSIAHSNQAAVGIGGGPEDTNNWPTCFTKPH